MEYIMKQLKKYLVIYGLFIKSSLMAEMEYRTNFIASMCLETVYFIIKIIYVMIVYDTGVDIEGISPDAVFMFMGSYMFMTGVYCSFFIMNFLSIPGHVRNGTLDMYITKPISLRFITTMRQFNIGFALPNLFGGLGLISIGWIKAGVPMTAQNIFGFIGFILLGTALCYVMMILPQLLSFWIVKTDGIVAVTFSIWDINQMPMNIYTKGIQQAGIYIIPIFVIANFAPQFVLGSLNTWQICWAFISLVIFTLISRTVWNRAMKRYNSVNN